MDVLKRYPLAFTILVHDDLKVERVQRHLIIKVMLGSKVFNPSYKSETALSCPKNGLNMKKKALQ